MKWILFYVIFSVNGTVSGTVEFNQPTDCLALRADMLNHIKPLYVYCTPKED